MTTFTKRFLALMLGAVMLLGLLAGCSEKESSSKNSNLQTSDAPVLAGMVVLSATASYKISYDQDGMVLEIGSATDDSASILASYTDYSGKTCSAVVKELIAATAEATLLRESNNIVLKLAVGSVAPSESFLDDLASVASAAAVENGCSAPVVTIGLEDLDAEGYINAETAQTLLKNELGVTEFESYNGDTSPRNDCYTVYVKTANVEGAYLIDAVTGLISVFVDEETSEPEYIEEESDIDISFEEEVEETYDESLEEEDPAV